MSQYDFGTINPASKSGTALAADLNSWRTAVHSSHKGSARPSYVIAGMMWLKDSVSPNELYLYDGTSDILVGTFNTSTHVFTVSGIGSLVQAYSASLAFLNVAQSWTKAQRGSVVTLTDAATISIDMADGNNFTVTLGGNRTLGNPSNIVAGQSGTIEAIQDATGTRTLAYGSYYKFPGGTAPVIQTGNAAKTALSYYNKSSTEIWVNAIKDFK